MILKPLTTQPNFAIASEGNPGAGTPPKWIAMDAALFIPPRTGGSRASKVKPADGAPILNATDVKPYYAAAYLQGLKDCSVVVFAKNQEEKDFFIGAARAFVRHYEVQSNARQAMNNIIENVKLAEEVIGQRWDIVICRPEDMEDVQGMHFCSSGGVAHTSDKYFLSILQQTEIAFGLNFTNDAFAL